MNLKDLYPNKEYNFLITGVTSISQRVKPGYIFVAIKGENHDGHHYILDSIKNGAAFIVYSDDFTTTFPHAKVKDTKLELIRLLQIWNKYSPKIYSIGVTGTDGKTSTSMILHHILNYNNESSYIGTNGTIYKDNHISSKITTPYPESFYPIHRKLQENNIKKLVMEVSSEGIKDKRIADYSFHGAIFTNLTHEHLNSHNNMHSYFLCKATLFRSLPKYGLAVINSDDKYGRELVRITKCKVVTYGINSGDYRAKDLSLYENHLAYDLYVKDIYVGTVGVPLFGSYNVYNSLAAVTYSMELGVPFSLIKKRLFTLEAIPGRFIKNNYYGVNSVIDYAHTPNALANILTGLRKICQGKLILVVGSQGGKDWSKRGKIGEIAVSLADIVIFTSEDPKNESLLGIFSDIISRIKNADYYLTYFRSEGIKLACKLAKENDYILVVGKGNETEEIFKNYHFKQSDSSLIKYFLQNKNALN